MNSVQGGAGGTGGAGGAGGSNGLGKGAAGQAGQAGESDGGALYVNGGAVDLFNSTVALNTQTGDGSGGGVVQVKGTVTATSTLFAGNGTVDYSGDINATNSLFQTAPTDGTVTGSNNLIGDNPLLATAGLANNGGPTQTIALAGEQPGHRRGGQSRSPLHRPAWLQPADRTRRHRHRRLSARRDRRHHAPDGHAECARRDRLECHRPQPIRVHRHLHG